MGNDLSGTLDWLVPGVAEEEADDDNDVIVVEDDVIGSEDPVVVLVVEDSDVCSVEREGVSVSMLDGEASVPEVELNCVLCRP